MKKNDFKATFGEFGGQYVPEILMGAINELEEAYRHYRNDPKFKAELTALFNNYANRPSLLYYAENMSKDLGGAKIYIKREDLNHTGAHKINNVLGQTLLAKKMGKKRIIAETGAGQHGVATASATALFGLECEIFMGEVDTQRQALNVYRMQLMGAKVNAVKSGTRTLRDAVDEALIEWTRRFKDTHYLVGSVVGPYPFPAMVRDFQSVISYEARKQIIKIEKNLPKAVIACVGGGSNAIGAFYNFISDKDVDLIGVEAGGLGINTPHNAAAITLGKTGVFHGMKSIFCQNNDGQLAPSHSISAGLDYPGVGPELAGLHAKKRIRFETITDAEAVNAFEYLSKTEGIIPAIESSHAVAYAIKAAKKYKDGSIIINLSGRGDKDVAAIKEWQETKR